MTKIVFAAPREVIQPLPPAFPATGGAIDRAAVSSVGWAVQLGAFGNVQGARDAWQRVSRRSVAFEGRLPREMAIRTRGATLHRLSIAGFDRGGADALCARYRAEGGTCFVRRGAGDRIARWKPGVEVAGR